jgi:hypothetical protein
MIKRSSASGNSWRIWDFKRDSYNAGTKILLPDASDAENSTIDVFDLVSNGFKIRSSGDGINNNGSTYIFAAFAEFPQKFSLAR